MEQTVCGLMEGEEAPEPEPLTDDPDEVGDVFVKVAKDSGMVDSFCENAYDGDADECRVRVADRLDESDVEHEPEPEPEPSQSHPPRQQPPQPVPQQAQPEGVEPRDPDEFDDSLSTIVADCVGERSFFGFSKPNRHACLRAFERQERRIERLEGHF